MISLNNLFLSYDNEKTYVLSNLELRINRSDMIAIVGDSGVGKTSLINILAGLLKPDKGSYVFDKTNIEKLNEKEVAVFRNDTIGVVFQNYNLLYDVSVETNILLPIYIKRRKTKQSDKVLIEDHCDLIRQLGIEKLIKKMPSELSGGEQQRVAFARALINKPDLIIADEPTGNLDGRNTENIYQILKKYNSMGKTVLVVTHDNEFAKNFEIIYILKDGKLQKFKR
jgi:ABC-type lipoprotein export system ATPase subunit